MAMVGKKHSTSAPSGMNIAATNFLKKSRDVAGGFIRCSQF